MRPLLRILAIEAQHDLWTVCRKLENPKVKSLVSRKAAQPRR